ncbi:MAG: hypothetical protein HYR91_15050 [Flavobacteriia bacterium]|nr:hypothetical protein [Flavobacteriia bacterium]
MKLNKSNPEFWIEKENFYNDLNRLIDEFINFLKNKNTSVGNLSGYERVARLFVKHIKDFTDYLNFEDIKVSDATTKFYAHVKWEGLKDWDKNEIRIKLKGFVEFVISKGHQNHLVFESLK